MGRFLAHMHDGGARAILARFLLERIYGMFKDAADPAFLPALEKLRAGGDQRPSLFLPYAVIAGFILAGSRFSCKMEAADLP
jgi:hypothetical protein